MEQIHHQRGLTAGPCPLHAMSDLQRAWARAKLGIGHDAFDETEEDHVVGDVMDVADDDSSSASSASSVSSTGTIVPTANQRLFARPNGYVEIFH